MSMPAINVWVSLDNEHALERIARQARDAVEVARRIERYAEALKVKAQRGDRNAECALAVLCDVQYEALAEAQMEEAK